MISFPPLVSIVIPTYESQTFIGECLKSIKNQTYPSIEVIVIDNFSKDSTRAIAESYGALVITARSIMSEARNIGASLAKGQFLMSIDSDMVLGKNVVTECLKESQSNCDAIIIPEISFGQGFWAKCKTLEKMSYINNDMVEAARFFNMSSFNRTGGYDPILNMGEDWDLHQRIKLNRYRVGRINETILHNEGDLTLKNAVMKKYYYGKSFNSYRKKHPKKAAMQLSNRFSLIAKLPLFTHYPRYAVGMLLMKFCELMAFLIGMI